MRILLVRLREIGDVVFTTPAVHALRRRFPEAHLAYIVEPAAAPIVANNPHINDVIVAPRTRGPGGLRADFALMRGVRRRGVDLAIDFHGGPRASLLTWLSGAPVRIGYNVAGRSWMYTRRVDRPRALRPRHSVENQWDLLAALDIAAPGPEENPVEMPVEPRAAAALRERLHQAGVNDDHEVVVVHVSAGNPFRRWPLASFAAAVAGLAAHNPRRRIVVTSGPSERDARTRVIDEARAGLDAALRERVAECGEIPLGELRALVDRAVLFVGGDSGPLHIAATSGVPIVALYGPTLPARSAPWRDRRLVAEAVEPDALACRPCDQRACVHGDFRCLTTIGPAQVLEAANRALARSSK